MASRNFQRCTLSELGTAWFIENGLVWGIAKQMIHSARYLQISAGLEWAQEKILLHTFFSLTVGQINKLDKYACNPASSRRHSGRHIVQYT
eukprot:13795760-Ditylum_brightwellii.AAC.2